jgi:hypothetical protein
VLSLARLQFVMNIDEQLFATFAPRSLKRALAKSAELIVASVPTFHGLDLAPVLKLIGALTMVGYLVGMVIVPQNSQLDDAKSTLCSMRRAPVALFGGPPLCTVFCVRRRVGQLGVDQRQARGAVVGRPEQRGRQLDRRKRHRSIGCLSMDGAGRRVDALVPGAVRRRRAGAWHQRRAPVDRADVHHSFPRRVPYRLVG